MLRYFKINLFGFVFFVLVLSANWAGAQSFQKSDSNQAKIDSTSVLIQQVEKFENKVLFQRFNALDEQIRKLLEPSSFSWDVFAKILDIILWPIVITIFVLIFKIQIRVFLTNLASNIGRLKIKIGNTLELSAIQINDIVVEYEKLKMGILIAVIDNQYDEREFRYLAGKAKPTAKAVSNLSEEDKMEILQDAIDMAMIDQKFKSIEYETIKNRSREFKISDSDLNKMIIDRCISNKIDPPPELSSMYTQRKKEREREH